jgi:upstream activation factor subunit UAF30
MADVNISDFAPTIKSILLDSDLHEITARDVRMKLEQKFKVDLTSRKQEVQKLIDRCFDDVVDTSGEQEEPKVPKKKKYNNSEEKSKKSSTDKSKKSRPKGRPPKTQIKTRDSDYSSLEDDSPPQKKKRGRKPKGSSARAESSDAEYERKFEEVLLNESNEKKSKSKSNGTTSKKKSSKRKKRDDDEQDGEERKKRKKGNTGIHKPLILSSVLAEFLQAEEVINYIIIIFF